MESDTQLPSKDDLERMKLRVEIDLLKSQVSSQEYEKSKQQRKELQTWLPTGISALAVLCTVVTVGIQSCHYLAQRQRQYEVQVDQQMLQLAKSLSDPTAAQREQAALLLSSYELNGLPILLAHLRLTNEPEPVLESLRLIKRKKRVGPSPVIEALLQGAEMLFASYRPGSGGTPYINYIRALGELAHEDGAHVWDVLKTFRARITGDTSVTEAEKVLILNEIRRSCSALQGRDCV